MQPSKPSISVIIPAWNEAERIGTTLQHLRRLHHPNIRIDELIVVDDGSEDDSWRVAEPYADRIIRHARKRGKGAALDTGWREAKGKIVVFLDADLGTSAAYAGRLIEPLTNDAADMTIAKFPPSRVKGGFGLVKGLAVNGIYRLSGFRAEAPLSGQRALKREVLEKVGSLAQGFGIEVGLTIDAMRHGFHIVEVEVPFEHRETGRDWSGFLHRGRQFWAVGKTLLYKWRHPI